MALAPLDAQQLAEAREWAAQLGVPEEEIIADAQAAKDEGYLEAARAQHEHEAGWPERMAGAGRGYMMGGPDAEVAGEPATEAEAG
jgi:hypothetical protein